MKNKKIELKKDFAELFKAVEEASKPDHCLLCGKKNIPICYSHIVPQFVLRGIADKGMICYGQSLFKRADITETKKGIKNAFTFRLICRECDQKKFANYEKPDTIVNFDALNNDNKNNVLIEMALKTHLAHIYSKVKSFKLREALFPQKLQQLQNLGLPTAFEIDIQEHFQYIHALTAARKSTSFTFDVLYNELLDYETGVAAQTIIAYQYDLNGNQLFDPKDFSASNSVKYFYLMILPYNGKTRIIFYTERKHRNYLKPIIEQFNTLNQEEKLHFLFISLIVYDEQFYINPALQEKINKDKKLIKLYTDTDMACVDGNACKGIKNFRKYRNYLLLT